MSTDLQHEQKSEVKEGLPKFLRFSIFALIAVTLISVVALFVDNIEGKGIKITLTFVIFAMFVGLAALDTLKGSRRSWYAPAAFLGNAVFLGASILTIWLTPGVYFGFTAVVLFHILVYLGILRLGVLFGMLAMSSIDAEEAGGRVLETYERKSSLWAAWLGGVVAALFVVYIAANQILTGRAINYQLFAFWDIYLKLSTALLIVAGLALSISLLLRWFFGADERALRKAELASQAHLHSDWEAQNRGGYGQSQWPTPQPQQPLLPWPTFDDGRPFPAGANGQPDFEAAKREAAKREAAPATNSGDREWFSEQPQATERPAQQEESRVAPREESWTPPAQRSADGWQLPQRPQGWHGGSDYPKQ